MANSKNILKTYPFTDWDFPLSSSLQAETLIALEEGHVIYFPQLAFQIKAEEHNLLNPDYIHHQSKNISFDSTTQKIRGIRKNIQPSQFFLLQKLLERFAKDTTQFINKVFPHYRDALQVGRTSFRPVEIAGRVSSYRKDDTRLHVDAFPANPNHGLRILRIFCNINPHNIARVWRLGEPFEKVAHQFLPKIKKPFPGSKTLLHWLGITKKQRSLYDHYMLQIHDRMKGNLFYQKKADQQEVHFSANSTWIVQTDHVSHAAMSGQHVLEQTFYLPVNAMQDETKSPLRILENLLNQNLV